jgi:signal transduction histidine kinase
VARTEQTSEVRRSGRRLGDDRRRLHRWNATAGGARLPAEQRNVISRGIAGRIALAAIASAAVGLVILGVGVAVVGADVFTELMMKAGDSAEHAREMYDDSVTRVVIAATVVAVLASVGLAIVLARMLAKPLAEIGGAARRIADGDYAARVPREGPEEVASLADSFNQMAASLERQEEMRRDFIANAAHELRTPLTNLQGYLEALRDGVITADRATYESLHEEADRLVRLSRSLDALAEGDAGASPPHFVDLDLAMAIRSAMDLAAPSAERAGLRLESDMPTAVPARADPDRLAQVLANLLTNAVHYTPAGGSITVRAERRPGDVLVSVSNTGDEIPAEDLDRVFERFYRVEKSRDRARGGAGIGLAIVKQLVESFGGRVGAESRDGLTRFWFSVPAS